MNHNIPLQRNGNSIPVVGTAGPGRWRCQTKLAAAILRLLTREGELSTASILCGVSGGVGRTRADVERTLCDLLEAGALACERRPAPTWHGAGHGREWTYWRLAGAAEAES